MMKLAFEAAFANCPNSISLETLEEWLNHFDNLNPDSMLFISPFLDPIREIIETIRVGRGGVVLRRQNPIEPTVGSSVTFEEFDEDGLQLPVVEGESTRRNETVEGSSPCLVCQIL